MKQLTSLDRDEWKYIASKARDDGRGGTYGEVIADHKDFGRVYLRQGADSAYAWSWQLGEAYIIGADDLFSDIDQEKAANITERMLLGCLSDNDGKDGYYEQAFVGQEGILAAMIGMV